MITRKTFLKALGITTASVAGLAIAKNSKAIAELKKSMSIDSNVTLVDDEMLQILKLVNVSQIEKILKKKSKPRKAMKFIDIAHGKIQSYKKEINQTAFFIDAEGKEIEKTTKSSRCFPAEFLVTTIVEYEETLTRKQFTIKIAEQLVQKENDMYALLLKECPNPSKSIFAVRIATLIFPAERMNMGKKQKGIMAVEQISMVAFE